MGCERLWEKKQPQILRLTTPRLKKTPGAPFAQDDSGFLLRASGPTTALFVVVEEAEDVVFLEAVAAFEEVEFDGEGEASDLSA